MKGSISFVPGAVQHVYQRTIGGFLLFYSVKDYLVFFTVFAVAARRYNVRILALCLMVDHIHVLVQTDSRDELEAFVTLYTSWFAKRHNAWYDKRGQVFPKSYGLASKVTDKSIRSAIAYVYCNPVERRMVSRAEQSRWNFLAFADSRFPFSESMRLERASAHMRQAVKEIKATRLACRPLGYVQLNRIFSSLAYDERLQLTDLIINQYNCIDYTNLIARFGSYEKMVMAINTTTGSEYAFKEEFAGYSDKIYDRITDVLQKTNRITSVEDLLRRSERERYEMTAFLAATTGATRRQIEKYLRLPGGYVAGR